MSSKVETVVLYGPVLLAAASQMAALFGKPKIVQKIGIVSQLFDILAGNYGKAKNDRR